MNKADLKLGLKTLKVKYKSRDLGLLAMTKNKKIAFSYEKSWIDKGFSISPFYLPLEDKVFVADSNCFEGLFGIFADSLPDAWGRLLLDRVMKEHNIKSDITVLDRLALVGKDGMGALEYEPAYELVEKNETNDLDYLSIQCQKVLQTEFSEDLDMLYMMAGSSGGARPKILTEIDNKNWIIKFPSQFDTKDIGRLEYDYSLCAKKCGIDMTETRLFESRTCKGYFGTVRFDRKMVNGINEKVHVATAASLLEADYNTPCMDYHSLMKLTRILTRENKNDVENMFRRMCFNVFAHNRDDHAKNFSFIYNDDAKQWRLSPAYDLTYSNTYYGEHTTSVDGNGTNPGEKEILNVGLQAGMRKNHCMRIIEEIKNIVLCELKDYLKK